MKYPSKIDTWLFCIIWGIPILFIIAGSILLLLPNTQFDAALTLLGGGIGLALFMLIIAYPVEYEIAPPTLTIRYGIFRKHIPLAAIRKIFPTNNPLSSPALSLDRLQIDYQTNNSRYPSHILISPKDKQQFIDMLSQYTNI